MNKIYMTLILLWFVSAVNVVVNAFYCYMDNIVANVIMWFFIGLEWITLIYVKAKNK